MKYLIRKYNAHVIYQSEVDAQTIEEYLDLEKKIANAETLR